MRFILLKQEAQYLKAHDEDAIMAEGDDDSDRGQDMPSREATTVYPESPVRMTPRFGASDVDPMHYELTGNASPQWSDIMDEKGEGVFYTMHLDKMIVHQNFFNSKAKDRVQYFVLTCPSY